MINIRTLSQDEQPLLLAFAKRIKKGSEYQHPWFSSPKDYESGHVLGAFENGQIVGAALINHGKRRTSTKIYYIDVLPECRGDGIGRELIDFAGKESPWEWIILKCAKDNEGGHAFYNKLGFTATGEDDGHIIYERRIG